MYVIERERETEVEIAYVCVGERERERDSVCMCGWTYSNINGLMINNAENKIKCNRGAEFEFRQRMVAFILHKYSRKMDELVSFTPKTLDKIVGRLELFSFGRQSSRKSVIGGRVWEKERVRGGICMSVCVCVCSYVCIYFNICERLWNTHRFISSYCISGC